MRNSDNDLSGNFSGRIYNVSKPLDEQSLIALKNVFYQNNIIDKVWEFYIFNSDIPLNANDEKDYIKGIYDLDIFINELLCCRAQKHFLIFTKGRKAYSYFDDNMLSNSELHSILKPCYIAVDAFVKSILFNKAYILTSLGCFYKGTNEALKSVLLYGEDIADADLFSKNSSLLNIYRVGIRETGIYDELISLSSDGLLNFNYNKSYLLHINNLFKYLKENNFLR